MSQGAARESRSPQRDPANCKACVDWDDKAGRCRFALHQRLAICGAEAVRYAASVRRTEYDLYDDPLLSRAERGLRQLVMMGQ
jgi:hypothetical protein